MPGVPYPMVIEDPAVAAVLVSLYQRGLPYIGVFLERQDGGSGSAVADPLPGLSDGGGGVGGAVPEAGEAAAAGSDVLGGSPVLPSFSGPGRVRPGTTYDVGCLAQIWRLERTPTGLQVVLLGRRRLAIREDQPTDEEVERAESQSSLPVSVLKVEYPVEAKKDKENETRIKAYVLDVMHTIKEILQLNPLFKEQLNFFLATADMDDPAAVADVAPVLTSATGHEMQEVLEAFDLSKRLHLTTLLLKKELELNRVRSDIATEVKRMVASTHRTAQLHAELKTIQKELGILKDEKELLIQKYQERLRGKEVPAEVSRVIDEEVAKLRALDGASAEANVSRTYLDWLSQMPWGVHSKDNLDFARAEEVLEREHFGMPEVKARILEFIAVGSLRGSIAQGKILCLVGPPGTGKTSVGRSMAHALGREFFRFSVGSLSDVSEIRGHRRTYIGAMPGKIVQSLKRTQTLNPVILIDEIDKLDRGVRGDPAGALLEVLDPEQQSTFVDHYLDVPVDLSKVLFVTTANTLATIPAPLLDRMETIHCPGYVEEEMEQIARRYLEPRAREACGVRDGQAEITSDALRTLIRWYCREAGVRRLEQQVEKIYRKIALKLVRGADAGAGGSGSAVEAVPVSLPLVVDASNLSDFVGKPLFSHDRIYGDEATPPGVAMGLAWSAMGGAVLYVESIAAATAKGGAGGGGTLRVTGHLGEVMKESAELAFTVARRQAADLAVSSPAGSGWAGAEEFLASRQLHLHFPEGATPKDGPSAGITMVTSLLSLASGVSVRPDLAMTGEVTLGGRVLKIGGVREKVIAARRGRVKELIFPADNRRDVEELDAYILEGLTFHYVDRYDQVRRLAFADSPSPVGATAPTPIK